ncbi:uncharacterized protein FTOL_00217 [Fusarium torulosum]|uniref:Uncharacterized protein n=1 Tax=Fusarium torulosum TaxID=33205 RepID=A0AAE8LXP7_9HYPO|nr:uncharacterized protein FTOL_00217 [Fusarium torulosum]
MIKWVASISQLTPQTSVEAKATARSTNGTLLTYQGE